MQDIIIVGAGPAGTSTATFLAKKGYNILLLEKEKFPRDKVCGDAIGPTSLRRLKEIGICNIEKENFKSCSSVCFFSPSNTKVKAKLPLVEGLDDFGLIIQRKKIDYILADHAIKFGVKLIEQFEVKQPLIENNKVIGVKGIYKGKQEIIKSKIVVAADGTHSTIARKLAEKGRKHKSKYSAIAVRTYFENVEELGNYLEIYYEKSILPAYGWIFPISNTSANVGVAIHYRHYKKQNKTITQLFYDFINNNKYAKRKLKNAKMIHSLKGWPVSYDSHPSKKYHSGVIFVGDAASLVDPLSGEGISNALLSGKLAAKAIDLALRTNDYSELKNYQKEWDKLMKPSLNASVLLQHLMSYPFIVDRVIKKANQDEKLAQTLSGCITGIFPKTKMLSSDIIRRIIF
ncbi:hypothetical protein AMJ49_06750 [Parcubacteria bacterium DG_74_2]|nr:MAG: hypothetical protein AMJ49_06750 [Parcubacteria bacterium DG_74_2]